MNRLVLHRNQFRSIFHFYEAKFFISTYVNTMYRSSKTLKFMTGNLFSQLLISVTIILKKVSLV